MKREYFIMHLEAYNCNLVRPDKKGYSVYRSEKGLISGVPVNDPLKPATVCRICKTLDIPSPADMQDAKNLIDKLHDDHHNGELK